MRRIAILQCVWLTCWCPVKWAVGEKRRKKDDDESRVQMLHHSFANPLSFDTVLNDWAVSGASLVERERLLLHPSVPERAAFAWNKFPLLTNNFEVIVHFRSQNPKAQNDAGAKQVPDQSFACWYVYDNVTSSYNETSLIQAESWKAGMEEAGMTLSGAKAKFHGFGAIMSMTDGKAKPRSVISALWNSGDKELKYSEDVPTSDAKAADFRNTMNPAQLKIRVTPTSIEGHFKESPSLSWNEGFKLDRSSDPVKAGGYIGFSAWSGANTEGAEPDLVYITKVEAYNLDTTSIGEEMKDVSAEIQEAYREMLTDEKRHFMDQKSQTDHLARLSKMLSEHTEAAKPADKKIFEDLQNLTVRMSRLGDDCKTLTKEVQVLVGDEEKGEGLEIAKKEIIGLRRLFIKDSESHREQLNKVHKNIAEVKSKHLDAAKPEAFIGVAKQSADLEVSVQNRSTMMTWMMLIIIVAVIVIGVLMWNKMSYYEKKHFI